MCRYVDNKKVAEIRKKRPWLQKMLIITEAFLTVSDYATIF